MPQIFNESEEEEETMQLDFNRLFAEGKESEDSQNADPPAARTQNNTDAGRREQSDCGQSSSSRWQESEIRNHNANVPVLVTMTVKVQLGGVLRKKRHNRRRYRPYGNVTVSGYCFCFCCC